MNLKRDKKKIKINKKKLHSAYYGKDGWILWGKPFKIHAKRKKDNYGQILDGINKDNVKVR